MSATKYLLCRGDKVRLAENPKVETEVHVVGKAGFKVQEKLATLWWHDRGKTWTSDKLDRLDATKAQFKQAATGGGKNGQ